MHIATNRSSTDSKSAELPAATSDPAGREAGSPVLGRLADLEVRLATTPHEIRQAQHLRYKVFYGEFGASPDPLSRSRQRDIDEWDDHCDHLLVVDHAQATPRVVGTYRLLRASTARERRIEFCTQSEFDIAGLMARHRDAEFMELGRSCVLAQWRTRRTIELLWHGIWSYVLRHRVDVMTGCASFPGTDPDAFKEQLSFLHHFAALPDEWQASPSDDQCFAMNLMGLEKINQRRAISGMPPLIKGYLRLGGRFASHAVVDHRFSSIDVLVVLPVAWLSSRYVRHYGDDASRHA